jgi:ABC-type multidrug transport system fused ATPase/permease subunit/glycosyltransferase involved in cell wall biosynthesis
VRVVYLLRSYPRLSQTFITNEIVALERLGVPVELFSMTRATDGPVQAAGGPVRTRPHYLEPALRRPRRTLLAEHVRFGLRRPLRYARAACYVVRRRDLDTGYTTGSRFQAFAQAVYLARTLVADGGERLHLHSHFAHDPTLIAFLVRRLTGTPYSFTAHARDLYETPVRTLAERAQAATAVVTCCGANADYLRRVVPAAGGKVRVIHHGVDATLFRPGRRTPSSPPLVLSAGRLVEKKGFGDLLRACALLAPDVRGRILGDGPMCADLARLVAELGLEERVELGGGFTQADLARELGRAAVFALTPVVMAPRGRHRRGRHPRGRRRRAHGTAVSRRRRGTDRVQPGVTGCRPPASGQARPGRTGGCRGAVRRAGRRAPDRRRAVRTGGLMITLRADITMHTAPRIVLTSLLGCAIVGVLIFWLLRRASQQAEEGRPVTKRGDVRRAVRLIARFTRSQHRLFVTAFVLLSIEAVTSVFAWYPLSYMIDYFDGTQGPLSFPGIQSPRNATIAVLVVILIVLEVVNSATDSLAEICLARGGRTLGFRMRVGLFSHLQRLSMSFHDRSQKGDVIFRVVGDVKEFEQFVIDSLSDLAGSTLLLIATVVFLLYEAWQVMLVGLIVIPGTSLISWYFSTRIKAAAKRQRAREGELAAATQEMLGSIRVVQTFGRGGHDERRFVDNSSRAMTAALDAARLDAWFSWIVTVFEVIAIAAVIWIGVYLMDSGALSLGTLTLVVLLIRQMFKPSRRIIKEWNVISKVFASVERIAEVLDRPITVHDEPGAVAAPPLAGRIEFRDVTFAYSGDGHGDGDGAERPSALSDVSFAVEPGEVVALAGPSGAGKTTVAQLIPRLYDPDRGAVLLDSHDVRGLTLESVRSQISMVLPETSLISGTVADNIAYGLPDATREQVVSAAVRANADGFISLLPNGYDCDLTEQGANLSSGQRQRIAIARALIRDTPIMILDEPTTGLDIAAAEAVLEGLGELIQGRTALVISHDFNLLQAADRILVLDHGRIADSGTHDELVARGDGYARLHGTRFAALGSRTIAVQAPRGR